MFSWWRNNKDEYPDIVGLIAFDRQVVTSSIMAKYPNLSTNPIDYLFKLVNLTVQLPLPSKENIETLLKIHLTSYLIEDSEKDRIASVLSRLVVEEQGRVSLRHAITLIRQYTFGKSFNSFQNVTSMDTTNTLALMSSALLGLISPEHFDELINIPTVNTVRENCCRDLMGLLKGDRSTGNLKANSIRDEQFWRKLQLTKLLEHICNNPRLFENASQLLVLQKV